MKDAGAEVQPRQDIVDSVGGVAIEAHDDQQRAAEDRAREDREHAIRCFVDRAHQDECGNREPEKDRQRVRLE